MSKYAVFFLIVLLIACDKKQDPAAATTTTDAHYSVSVTPDCTLSTTAAHAFQEWGTQVANNYSCTGQPRMTCTLHISTDGQFAEERCLGNDPLNLNGVPTGCTAYGTGMRSFLDGTFASATAYDCGVVNGLRCFYHFHDDVSVHANRIEDMICLDDDY